MEMNSKTGRNVFISFLGTNNYLQTKYLIGDKESKPVRFIQEALTDSLCSEWGKDDRIYIFYTEESKKKNWEDGGQPNVQEDAEIERKGLRSVLSSKPYSELVEDYTIAEGFSETEVWKIFDEVYSKLQEGDNVYFDVTHAFRSIPLFSTVLFYYARFTKGINLRQVCYGAFEKLGPAYTVKTSIPIEERIAPVLDLNNIIQLQNLTQIAHDFVHYGKIKAIGEAFEQRGNSKQHNAICQFRSAIEKMENYILTNKIKELEEGKFVNDIDSSIKLIEKVFELTGIQKELIEQLKTNICAFKVNGGLQNIIAASEWAIRYDMISTAYILVTESIITVVHSHLKDYLTIFNEELDQRDFVSSLLNISSKDREKRNYKKTLAKDFDLTDRLLEDTLIQQLRSPFQALANCRNMLCHGKKSDLTIEQYKKRLVTKFAECKRILGIE